MAARELMQVLKRSAAMGWIVIAAHVALSYFNCTTGILPVWESLARPRWPWYGNHSLVIVSSRFMTTRATVVQAAICVGSTSFDGDFGSANATGMGSSFFSLKRS